MNAWETIIQQLRAGDVRGATQSYIYATKVSAAEAREVIEKALDKVKSKTVQTVKKEINNGDISDQAHSE